MAVEAPAPTDAPSPGDQQPGSFGVERNGVNVIAESERTGVPRSLFWPWAASNISVLGISYGSFVLGFGIGFWQAAVATVVGVTFSFLLVGLVAIAGKRGSAPTMVLSRAPFGVAGNRLPALVGYLLTVGWETVLVTLSTLATVTVLDRLGWSAGTGTKVTAFVVVAVVVVAAGLLGFRAIFALQKVLTIALVVLTIGFVALTASKVDWTAVQAVPSGSRQAVLGALILLMTGFGLGWVNAAADYSRYLPRRASTAGVVGWTTLGGALFPELLVVWGLLLVASDKGLADTLGADPVGALTAVLPTWFLVPFAVIAILGLIAGAVLDLYSSGLTLLSLGVRIPRWSAALVDGVLMVAGTVYLVFVASSFVGPFQGFLITLGVPIAAWCGVFLADLATRRAPYAGNELSSSRGRYGPTGRVAVVAMVLASVIGFGLVTNTASRLLSWQGFLLAPVGLGPRLGGPWSFANLGVLVALVLGFVVQLLFGRARVRAQERFG